MSVGATRNLTSNFMRYRESIRATSRPLTYAGLADQRLLAAALDSSAPPSSTGNTNMNDRLGGGPSLPPAWVDVSDEVGADMTKIRAQMSELAKLHSRALLVSFDDDTDTETSIEVVTQEVTRLFKRIEQRLRKLSEGGVSGTEEEKVRKNVLTGWAAEVQKLSQEFRKQQKDYLARMQQQQKPGAAGLNLDFDSRPRGMQGGLDPDDLELGVSFNDMQVTQVGTSDALVRERDQAVSNIVQSITDLAQVMKDLSVLVIDQGSILDRIDYNCEQVAVTVKQGFTEVVKAEKTQKKGRMLMCIMFLMVAVLLMFMVVVIKKVIL